MRNKPNRAIVPHITPISNNLNKIKLKKYCIKIKKQDIN